MIWLVKLNIIYLLWVENPICSPGSQAWPTQFYFVLQEVAQGRKMDGSSCCFVYKSVYVYICWMTCNVYRLCFMVCIGTWHPEFWLYNEMHLLMKCFDKYYFIMFCFGNKFRNSFKSKGFTLKIFKSINENRSFLAEILGMSQLVSEH